MNWIHKINCSLATKIDTGEEVAIKLEHCSVFPSFLEIEADFYRLLSGGVGIARVHDYLDECEYNVMVFDLLGPSLEDLFCFCGRRFSLKTVLMLADQLLHRLEYIHSKDVIHRDVKPENFLMGMGNCGNQVFITDLGLATERLNVQIKARDDRDPTPDLIGTARFASINGHLGVGECPPSKFSTSILNIPVQHRCDDLESLGYMLVYFLRGSLPWQGLKVRRKIRKEELILEKKKTISTEDLCRDLPPEFGIYFDNIRSLGFDETPSYSYLRKIFSDLFAREGFELDDVFDWIMLKYLMSTKGNKESRGRSSPMEVELAARTPDEPPSTHRSASQ